MARSRSSPPSITALPSAWAFTRSNQSLSFEIEHAYEQVTQTYPNIDPPLRTVLAWKQFHKDPASRSALTERRQSVRLYLAQMRHIEGRARRK